MRVRSLVLSQAHPPSERPTSTHTTTAPQRRRSRLPAGSRLRAETMSVMRFLAPAAAAGMIWSVGSCDCADGGGTGRGPGHPGRPRTIARGRPMARGVLAVRAALLGRLPPQAGRSPRARARTARRHRLGRFGLQQLVRAAERLLLRRPAPTAGAAGSRSTRNGRPGCCTATWASTRTRCRSTTKASRRASRPGSAGSSLRRLPARSIWGIRACSSRSSRICPEPAAPVRRRRGEARGTPQNRGMTDLSLAHHIGAILARAGEDADPAETAEWCEALDALIGGTRPRARPLPARRAARPCATARRALAALADHALRQHDRPREPAALPWRPGDGAAPGRADALERAGNGDARQPGRERRLD